jgi:hypothetical protein
MFWKEKIENCDNTREVGVEDSVDLKLIIV